MQTGTKERWNVAPLGVEDGSAGYSSAAGELSRRSSPLMFAESGDCLIVIVARSLRGAVGIESRISLSKGLLQLLRRRITPLLNVIGREGILVVQALQCGEARSLFGVQARVAGL